jgi:hypothetical protein
MKTSQGRTKGLLVVGAAGAVAATAVNACIYGAGRAADVAYVITQSSSAPERVGLGEVVSLSLMSFAVGLVAAAVALRFGRPSLRALQILGAVLAVVSTWGDFTIDGTAAATATLALMHIVVGVAYVTSLEIVRVRLCGADFGTYEVSTARTGLVPSGA